MSETRLLLIMVVASALLLVVARRFGLSQPLLLLLSGLAVGLTPGAPRLEPNPFLIIELLLPPLLYASTMATSPYLLRSTLWVAVLPGIVLNFATIGLVALVGRALIPDLPWAAAFLVGIIAAAFGTDIFREEQRALKVPRRLADKLRGEEMLAPAVILSCFLIAQDAAARETFSLGRAAYDFGVDVVGGAVLGAVVGFVFAWLRRRVDVATIEIALSFSTPYAAAVLAGMLGVSPVVVVMAAGFVVAQQAISRRTGATRWSAEARLAGHAFWEQSRFIVQGVLFFLIGQNLPTVIDRPGTPSLLAVLGYALVLLAVLALLRFGVALVATYLPYREAPQSTVTPRWGRLAEPLVIAWSGMGSAIAVVIALALPSTTASGAPFPGHDLILAFTGLLTLLQLTIQGPTLGPLIRWLGLAGDGAAAQETAAARSAAARAGLLALERPAVASGQAATLLNELREDYELRANGYEPSPALATSQATNGAARDGATNGGPDVATLHTAAVGAEHRTLLALRAENALGDEALRTLQHEIDIEAERFRTLNGAIA